MPNLAVNKESTLSSTLDSRLPLGASYVRGRPQLRRLARPARAVAGSVRREGGGVRERGRGGGERGTTAVERQQRRRWETREKCGDVGGAEGCRNF